MSPCEEGMSPNPAKWKKFPLNKESSKWFVGKPLSSRLTSIVCSFGTICGRESRNYIFVVGIFYHNSRETLNAIN